MRNRFALAGFIVAAVFTLGTTDCSGPGLPGLLGPSSCGSGAGPDRCAALNCPPGTHCALTGNCTAYCEQEQLSPH